MRSDNASESPALIVAENVAAPPSRFSVLLIEDSQEDRVSIRRLLRRSESALTFELREAGSGALGLAMCREQLPDCLLLDYGLGDIDGLSLLAELNAGRDPEEDPICPTVILTGASTLAQTAVRALKGGAQDYLVKETLTTEGITLAIANAVEKVELRRQLREAEARFRSSLDNMLDCFSIYTAVRDSATRVIEDFVCKYVNETAARNKRMVRDERVGCLLVAEMLPAHRALALFEEYVRVIETGEPLEKTDFVYGDVAFGEKEAYIERAFDIRVWKMGDGCAVVWRDITAQKRMEAERAVFSMKREQVAEAVQRSLLLVPPADAYPGITVQPFYQPALDDAMIGGDFFDVFAVSADVVALVVGDATGKGVEAAVYTAEIKFALRAFLREHRGDLTLALKLLNEFVFDNERFDAAHVRDSCTALTAVLLNTRTGEVVGCAAGAEPPLILRATSGEVVAAGVFGPLLGAYDSADYIATRSVLEPGDLLVLTTDGITELRSPSAPDASGRMPGGDFFGIDALMGVLREESGSSIGTLLDVEQAVVKRALDWAHGRQHDDICLLIAKRG